MDIRVNPTITSSQLYDFYRRNNICEAGYSEARAATVLGRGVIAAAFDGDMLVGIARAIHDGLAAAIMEFSIDLRHQGATKHANGSLVESDDGIGRQIGEALLTELAAQKIDFVSAYIVDDAEERFYASLGFRPNAGHTVYCIDKRPYV